MHQRGDRVQSGQRDNVVREQLMDFLEAVREVPFFHVGDAISTNPKTGKPSPSANCTAIPATPRAAQEPSKNDRGLRQGS